MNKIAIAFATFFLAAGLQPGSAQFKSFGLNDSWKKVYRGSAEKINDLVHTRLDVRFDFDKSYMYGKAWITLRPHFYNTDSLRLDAKGMDIKQVAMVANGKITPLQFTYPDSMQLLVNLGRTYKSTENYTIYIDYTAKPEELKTQGSAAIKDAKGLYFINPKGTDKNKPTEIWTQGETEAASAWFPTIDKPNQKTTEEINMTVPSKYVTLSNGLLTAQKTNTDGTRTDTWKMDLPHSPYLFFMGVGSFSIIKDSYKGKEVSYYVEKDFEKVARKIFGLTPEMITCFSNRLGVEYPWPKYAQMVGRDYVSGAMENTSATLHSEYLQQSARELMDGNKYEEYISHELFHQWFGDLVTAESWSNLTVNESMANYGEIIWDEYKYGQDAADRRNYKDMQDYIRSNSENKNLVRFYYRDKEDMFDRVTYEKGGRILYMLRNIVGTEAFFKSLNLYLATNKFKNGEAHQLRLAFEEVTGKDLNWFWNQWYYGSGHPKLDINYSYDAAGKKAMVIVQQKQEGDKVFKMPVAIDVYSGSNKTRYNVWMQNKADTFTFPAGAKPDLINFDGDKYLLSEKEENKTMAGYIYQYRFAKKYVDRREAMVYATANKDSAGAVQLLITGLSDPFYNIRQLALQALKASDLDEGAKKTVERIAKTDARRLVRTDAINLLGSLNNPAYKDLFLAATADSSYSVAGAGLDALSGIDESKALSLLPSLKNDAKGGLENAIETVEILQKTDADFDTISARYDRKGAIQRAGDYNNYLKYLGRITNVDNFRKGITKIVALRKLIGGFSKEFADDVNENLLALKTKKEAERIVSKSKVLEEEINILDKALKE